MKDIRKYLSILTRIVESDRAINIIKAVINKLEGEFGFDALSGGNCGQFAYAVAKYLNENGMNLKLALITNKLAVDNLKELQFSDPDVYHVVIQDGNTFYDATGKVDETYLANFAEKEYGDANPDFWSEIELDNLILSIVNNDTNWNISHKQFYNFLRTK